MYTLVICHPQGKKKNKFHVRDKKGKFVFESWAKQEASDKQIELNAEEEQLRLDRNAARRERAAKKRATKSKKKAA